MSEVENKGGQNTDTQSGETQSQAPAPDIQAEIQKALDEQRQGFERELEEATGHRSLSGFLEAHRQATEETRQRLEAQPFQGVCDLRCSSRRWVETWDCFGL